MRFKADSIHQISPELRAKALLMAGKLNAGNALQFVGNLNPTKLQPQEPKKDTK